MRGNKLWRLIPLELRKFAYKSYPCSVIAFLPQHVLDISATSRAPSSLPQANWPEHTVRATLATLCLVNHAWYESAKPWLWQNIEVRLPRSWLSLVEEISGGDDEEINQEQVVKQSIQAAKEAAMARNSSMGLPQDTDTSRQFQECILANLGGPDGSIPPELLSPPASRDPSPRRIRTKSKSPARWKMIRSISDAVQNAMRLSDPGFYGKSLVLTVPFHP